MTYALKYERRAVTASGLDFLAGVWLFISPFVLMIQHVKLSTASDVLGGLVIALMAVYRFFNPTFNRGVSWLVFVAGIWILICPFACQFAWNRTALINNVVLGIVVMILSSISATSTAKISPDVNVGMDVGR